MSDHPVPADGVPPAEAIRGVTELRRRTGGGSGVTIGVLDGPPELSHRCLAGADITVLEPWWLPPIAPIDYTVMHGTYVASLLFGQPGTPVDGLVPAGRGVFVPIVRNQETVLDPLNVARGIEALLEHGVDIILISVAHATVSDDAAWPLKRAIAAAAQAGVLVVVPAGNDDGACRNALAVLPQVLAVGAHRNDGVMFKFSNWGTAYQGHGIVAPGEAVIGAVPGGATEAHKGTSVSIALVAGAAALLLAAQRQAGLGRTALAAGQAMLRTARPCTRDESHGRPERCLDGKLDLPAATRLALAGREVSLSTAGPQSRGKVFALGGLAYDFGTEARRDTFKQLMPSVDVDGAGVPANPYDARQMVSYLRGNPSEAHPLIWTLNLDLTPIYAVEPVGGYAPGVYERLVEFLERQLRSADDPQFVDRVSVPGHLSGRTVKLFSGQHVPVVQVELERGLYGWSVAALTDELTKDRSAGGISRTALADFLTRIYHDLRNRGETSRDRALNFAATNTVQAREALTEALRHGMALQDIGVTPSPHGRPGSDIWDVELRFFDPDNSHRARRVHRYTIDVTDVMPTTVGPVRSWPQA